MAKATDIALIAGIGVVAFIILKAGRDLFGALPSLGGGLSDVGKGIGDFVNDAGKGIGDFFDPLIPNDTSNLQQDTSFQDQGGFDPNAPREVVGCQCGSVGSVDPVTKKFVIRCKACTEINQLMPSTLDPNRPLDLTQFASQALKNQFTPAELFAISSNKAQPALLEKLSGFIKTPQGFDSFEQGGFKEGGVEGFTITSNRPLSDVIRNFKEQHGIELTASQAANINSILVNDAKFAAFDFGTNTGQALVAAQGSFGRGSQDLELLRAVEAARAAQNEVFAGTQNFANPNFPITLGEAFLGKSGTVVSDSIHNLNDEQLQEFVLRFGS